MKDLGITAAIASLLLASCSGTTFHSERPDNIETLPSQTEEPAEQQSGSKEEPLPKQPQAETSSASDAGKPRAEGVGSSAEDAEEKMTQQDAEPPDSSEETSGDEGRDDSTDGTSVSDTPDDQPIGTEDPASSESSVAEGGETGTTASEENSEAGTEEPRKRWRVAQ